MTYDPKIGDPWPFRSSRGLTGRPVDPVWFGLITAPAGEARAANQLKAAGVSVLYPTQERTRHIRGQKRTFVSPMIPRIVYAQFRYAPNWDVMRDRRVITGVFCRGDTPIEISADDVHAVMGLPTEAERIAADRIAAAMPRAGEQAELAAGPFAGFRVDVTRVAFGQVWWEMVSGVKGRAPVDAVRRLAE